MRYGLIAQVGELTVNSSNSDSYEHRVPLTGGGCGGGAPSSLLHQKTLAMQWRASQWYSPFIFNSSSSDSYEHCAPPMGGGCGGGVPSSSLHQMTLATLWQASQWYSPFVFYPPPKLCEYLKRPLKPTNPDAIPLHKIP